jgi:hypothetical protein
MLRLAAVLALALAGAAAYALQLGHPCRSAKDCAEAQECVAHEDRSQDVVRRTCEYPCSLDAAAKSSHPPCPKGRVCVQLGATGPQSSLGGICVRMK